MSNKKVEDTSIRIVKNNNLEELGRKDGKNKENMLEVLKKDS